MANQIAFNENMIKSTMSQKTSIYNLTSKIDFFPRYKGKKLNIFFENSSGIKINIITPNDCKMKDLLTIFHIKLQMYGEDYKIKIFDLFEYYFLYNGYSISLNEEKTISEFGLSSSQEKIIFNLRNTIIGG